MNIKDLEKLVGQMIENQNNQGIADFEGLSPNEMQQILYSPFGEGCPLQLGKLSQEEYKEIPIFNIAKELMLIIHEKGEMKLTEKGFLPVKIVAELYAKGFFKEEDIEKGFTKLYKEADSQTISIAKIFLEVSGLTKKRNGKISLTTNGLKALLKDDLLMQKLLEAFFLKFNWGYFDGYENEFIAQKGAAFSLLLLSKYGNDKRDAKFYADKYFKAFPALLNNLNPSFGGPIEYATRCYILRTFERYFNYFGFIEHEKEGGFINRSIFVKKSAVFDKLFMLKKK